MSPTWLDNLERSLEERLEQFLSSNPSQDQFLREQHLQDRQRDLHNRRGQQQLAVVAYTRGPYLSLRAACQVLSWLAAEQRPELGATGECYDAAVRPFTPVCSHRLFTPLCSHLTVHTSTGGHLELWRHGARAAVRRASHRGGTHSPRNAEREKENSPLGGASASLMCRPAPRVTFFLIWQVPEKEGDAVALAAACRATKSLFKQPQWRSATEGDAEVRAPARV